MGNCFSDGSAENTGKTTTGNDQELMSTNKRTESRPKHLKVLLECKEMKRMGMRLYSRPILNGDNVIFLESSFLSGSTKYSIFDLNEGKMIKTEEIKHDDNDDDNDNNFMFDVFNTEYTLNTDNNTIYFIDNNDLNIKILNLDRNRIESLNKTIKTTEDNYGHIVYNNKRIYILGAEEITNNDEKGGDRFIVVPYSLAFKQRDSGKKMGLIKKFGQYSQIIATKQNECDYIYMMGGQTKYGINGLDKTEILPNDAMFICKCDGLDGEWTDFYDGDDQKRNGISKYFSPYPIHSFGIINYKNQYLFQFGGVQFRKDKVRKIDAIYLLPLIKNSKYKLIQFNWYEISLKLPQKGQCHVLLHNDIMIHLFYYSGKYYTFKIDKLFEQLDRGEPQGMVNLQPWSQQGKTVLPTKSKSIKNIGPKQDTDIDEMLEDLGEQYEIYQNEMGANCFDTYDDILNNEHMDKLKKIITNQQHLNIIMDKAKELKAKQQ